ncbi:MAG: anti-sigma factor antagonist [Solirubrobacteraceae bacterium]|jgi:anti-sigma B factor antagonist|nr:anti-sigma factor antagonist [Solirubrobacteraceae bacterium]
MTDLRIDEQEHGGAWSVTVHGDLDLSSAPDLCRRLTAHRGARVVVDLTDVGFCDSCGMRAIMGEAREARIAGGLLVVVSPAGSAVRRLLELCGLLETLGVHGDRDHALAAAA